MTSYTSLGSYILADNLTEDSIGRVHRGLSLVGSAFEHHFLIRSFSKEVLNSKLGEKIAEMNHVISVLPGSRGFGINYRIEADPTLHVACEYIPGRSLAQMIEKARQQQIPFGVDQAISVIQGVSQALLHLHSNGLSHGTLTPESIWISFEGAVQIIDAPFAAALRSVLPRCPVFAASLARYSGPTSSPLAQDFFSMGAIFHELLTFEKLPVKDQILAVLSRATLKAAQEDSPIPPGLLELLNRLLLVKPPFETPAAFNAELQRVLYEGDYSPTTFNLAYFMRTLFREENERDNQALKDDQAADFTPFVRSEAPEAIAIERGVNQGTQKHLKIAAAAAAIILGGLGYLIVDKVHAAGALAEQAEKDRRAAELKATTVSNRESDIQQALDKVKHELAEAKSAHEKAVAEAKKAQLIAEVEILNQKKVALQAAAQQPVIPKPVPPGPTKPIATHVATAISAPSPGLVALTAPSPSPATLPPPNPGPSVSEQEAPPTLTNRVSPVTPHPKKSSLPPSLQDVDISVAVKVMVSDQGQPVKVLILNRGVEGSFGYNEAARDAAMASSYAPATKAGKPISGWITLEYHFGRP